MRLMVVVFSMLTCLTGSVSSADAIDDRIAYGRQKSIEAGIADSRASSYQSNARRLQGFQRFIAEHGGLVEDGNCRVSLRNFVEENRPYEDDRGWRESTSWRSETLPYSSVSAAGEYSLRSCRLNLRDGLACDLSLTNESGSEGPSRQADCYDANGSYKAVRFNYLGGASAGRARQNKIKRKRSFF